MLKLISTLKARYITTHASDDYSTCSDAQRAHNALVTARRTSTSDVVTYDARIGDAPTGMAYDRDATAARLLELRMLGVDL